MHFRVSEGSTGSAGELEMPSDAFQRLRDSSFWSTSWVRRALMKIENRRVGKYSISSQVISNDVLVKAHIPNFAYSSTVFFSPAL